MNAYAQPTIDFLLLANEDLLTLSDPFEDDPFYDDVVPLQ